MRNRKNQGFTLVEVIVVAVIVAVLALVGIQLYQGYVQDARQNTAENLAASAAGFCQTALNSGMPQAGVAAFTGTTWTDTSGAVDKVFKVPSNATITIAGDSLTATIGTITSKGYKWR